MDNYLILLRNKIEKSENVSLFLYLRQKKLSYVYSKSMMEHRLLVGLSDLSKFSDIIREISRDSEIILSRIEPQKIEDIHSYKYKIFSNEKYIELIFVNASDINNVLKYLGNFEIISDKNDLLAEYDENLRQYNHFKIPDGDEYIEQCIEFYFELINIYINLHSENILKTNLLKSEIINKLINISNIFITVKYDNKIILDKYGQNIQTYLDEEYFNELLKITNIQEDTWTFMFKSAQLFRKIAMTIAEKKNYIYPKKQDVDIMEYLRLKYSKENK